MKTTSFALLALLLAGMQTISNASDAPAPTPTAPSLLSRLAWLGGNWEASGANRLYEEQWMQPAGGIMLGMARSVRDGRLLEFEQVRIEEKDDHLLYVANPSGQAMAAFASTTLTDSLVIFSNPEHDFPQRILYRHLPDGSVVARIEGNQDGKPRAVDFPMQRAPRRD